MRAPPPVRQVSGRKKKKQILSGNTARTSNARPLPYTPPPPPLLSPTDIVTTMSCWASTKTSGGTNADPPVAQRSGARCSPRVFLHRRQLDRRGLPRARGLVLAPPRLAALVIRPCGPCLVCERPTTKWDAEALAFVHTRCSEVSQHTTCAPFACVGRLALRIENAVRPEFECMVVERCMACGRRVMAWGVLPEPAKV